MRKRNLIGIPVGLGLLAGIWYFSGGKSKLERVYVIGKQDINNDGREDVVVGLDRTIVPQSVNKLPIYKSLLDLIFGIRDEENIQGNCDWTNKLEFCSQPVIGWVDSSDLDSFNEEPNELNYVAVSSDKIRYILSESRVPNTSKITRGIFPDANEDFGFEDISQLGLEWEDLDRRRHGAFTLLFGYFDDGPELDVILARWSVIEKGRNRFVYYDGSRLVEAFLGRKVRNEEREELERIVYSNQKITNDGNVIVSFYHMPIVNEGAKLGVYYNQKMDLGRDEE